MAEHQPRGEIPVNTIKCKPKLSKHKRRYLSPSHLSKRWDMSTKTLANKRSNGTGPAYIKVGEGKGARVRYPLKGIKAYEAARTVGSTLEFRTTMKELKATKKSKGKEGRKHGK